MASKRTSSSQTLVRQRTERRAAFPPEVPTRAPRAKRAIGTTTTVETPLLIRGPGLELDAALRPYVRQRTGFKLGKFALSITRVVVAFEWVSGPIGAPLYECRIKVLTREVGDVVVAHRGSSPEAAFATAVSASERAVRRSLDRIAKRHKRAVVA